MDKSKVIPFRPRQINQDEQCSLEEELHSSFMRELEKRIETDEEGEILCILTVLFFATSIVPEAIETAREAVEPSIAFLRECNCPILPELEQMIEDVDCPEVQEYNRKRIDEAVFSSGSFGAGIMAHPVEIVHCPVPVVTFIGNKNVEDYLQSDVARRTLIKIKGAKTAAYINFGL